MKKQTCIVAFASALLVSVLASSIFLNPAAANPIGYYYPWGPPPAPIVKVNNLDADKLTLQFSVQSAGPWITPYGMGADYEPSHNWGLYSISSEVFVDGKPWRQQSSRTNPITVSLEGLSNGWHTLEVIATAIGYSQGKSYNSSRVSSGAIEFQVDNPPPSVHIQSLKNTALSEGDFQFTLRVNGRTLSWVGYSLDGKENVTVNQEVLVQSALTPHDEVWTGNLTLTGLSHGSHSLVVYTEDLAGNRGASEPFSFTVATEEQPETEQTVYEQPFPTAFIATASASVAAICVLTGFLLYFKKFRHKDTVQTK